MKERHAIFEIKRSSGEYDQLTYLFDVGVDLYHAVHAGLGGPRQVGLLRVVSVLLVLINFDFLSGELHFLHLKLTS